MIGIIQRTFDHVDCRLINHGTRVSYLVYRMLMKANGYSRAEMRDLCLVAMLHDIGAYKLEEIDKMVQFETHDIWEHSVYGYLFLKYFSFLSPYALAVLFHHASWKQLSSIERVPDAARRAAQLINIADRADVFELNTSGSREDFSALLDGPLHGHFDPEVVELFRCAAPEFPFDKLPETDPGFYELLSGEPLAPDQLEAGLWMLVFAIDFRSTHTVTHTITTASISEELARRFDIQGENLRSLACGAMLHDLGKIAIPVEILEFPGKLSAQAMSVMRTHVELTGDILGDSVSPEIREIAVRHHEKLDGSGYPRGLTAEELTLPQRIVAVADIVSALLGTRSYKDSYPKEKTLQILRQGADGGQIDSDIVSVMIRDYDAIIKTVSEKCAPVLQKYEAIQTKYTELLAEVSKHSIPVSILQKN